MPIMTTGDNTMMIRNDNKLSMNNTKLMVERATMMRTIERARRRMSKRREYYDDGTNTKVVH